MRHLVTGATGFVGAAVALELLTRTDAEVVCLVRGADDGAATTRLHDALGHAAAAYGRDDLYDAIGTRTRAIAGDMTAPGCGVNLSALPAIDQVWHSAASLKFEDRHAAEIHTMNVVGTANVLDLTKALGGPILNHISTAYVAGSRTGPVEESVPLGTSHAHNLYEVSKIEAELLVAGSGLNWRILRPSVVIGHSVTRAATTFSGMYGFVSALLLFRRNIEGHFGQLLRYRQIPLIAEPVVELNLLPVDLVARNAVRIAAAGPVGSVFHLTNAAAPTVGVAISEFFHGSGLRTPRFVGDSGQLTSLDRKLDDAMDFYSSYLAYGKTFDRTNTDAVCGRDASEFALPAPTVRDFVDWYRARIRQDGRATAPGPQTFAFRRARPLAMAAH
jgi:nucleoside-diphosphate-sugar epimerase